jgi:Smr domain
MFSIGMKVRLKHSSEAGVVTELLGNSMVMVKLDGDFDIPVFEEDLVRGEAYFVQQEKIMPKKNPQKNQPEPPKPQRYISTDTGVHVAFDPLFTNDGSLSAYNMVLLNDTKYGVIYSIEIFSPKETLLSINGKLDDASALPLGKLDFRLLNDGIDIKASAQQITTAGIGNAVEKAVKVKQKHFFKKLMNAPLLKREMHVYLLFDTFLTAVAAEKKGEDLLSYTKRQVKNGANVPTEKPAISRFYELYNVEAHANFVNEIDLHIEKITDDYSKLNNGEMLQLQMHHFENFLAKALRVGVDRVFIIHGFGKGKLRQEIHYRLSKHYFVLSYKNEYHSKYGHGATEVVFG